MSPSYILGVQESDDVGSDPIRFVLMALLQWTLMAVLVLSSRKAKPASAKGDVA